MPTDPHLYLPTPTPISCFPWLPQPQPAPRPLTEHIDIGRSDHMGHSVAGTAFPPSMGLLGQGSEDEAAVAVHLGLTLQPPAHLENHWSALRIHAATPHQGGHSSLQVTCSFPPHMASDSLYLHTSSFPLQKKTTTRGTVGMDPGRAKSGFRSLTLAQETRGGGSP